MSNHEDSKIIIEVVQSIATKRLITLENITHEDINAVVSGLTGGMLEHHFLDQDDVAVIKNYLASRLVTQK